jgi:hypothetical protein
MSVHVLERTLRPADTFAGTVDATEEPRVVLEAVVEPVVLGFEADGATPLRTS